MADEHPAPVSPSGSSTDLLSVSQEKRADAVVVRFVGEIDLNSVGAVRAALTAALADATAPHPLVLDLTGVGFLASAGLAELQSAYQRAADKNVPLRIVATGRAVLRPLAVTGLAATLDIRADITSAVAPSLDQTPDRSAL
jgi:anti-sigma B factor antagonist